MTDTTTEAVERLMNDVTPGPWVSDPEDEGLGWGTSWRVVQAGNWLNDVAEICDEANAAFIAASRDLVPALLSERDALKAQLETVEVVVKDLKWRAYNELGNGRGHYGFGIFGH